MASLSLASCTLDTNARRLTDSRGHEVELRPQAMEMLCLLADRPNTLVTKQELLAAIWPGMVVTDDSLVQAVGDIRRALGDAQHRIVATVPKRGYRLVLASAELAPPAPEQAGVDARTPHHLRRRTVLFGTAAVCGLAAATTWWLRPLVAAGRAGPPAVAVLPFTAFSSAPGDESLAMGMADSLTARLSAVPGLVVRTVPFVHEGSGSMHDPVLAARDLAVDWIVDGGLHDAGGLMRISARLLRAVDGSAAWHDTYVEKGAGIFTIQEQIAGQLVAQLRPSARAERSTWPEAGGTRNLEAYRLYLSALWRHHWALPGDVGDAIQLLDQAVAIDPDYALAWTLLAQCHRQRILGEDAEPAEAFRSAKPAIERALLLEPDLSKARTERAFGWWLYEFDWERSVGEFHRALANNRNEARAYLGLAMLLLCTCGRVDEGLRHLRTACELDRTSPGVKVVEAHFLIERGRLEEARVRARHVLDVDSKWWLAHATMARLQFAQGRDDAGLSSLRAAARLQNASLRAKALLGVHLARVGLPEEARAVLSELVSTARTRYVPPTATGAVQAALGETAAALSSLELAAAVHDHRIVCAHNDPHWQALRREPRFTALLARLQLDRYGKGCSLP
jgi:DNA-binding winged helix-turn-helix (wHTH) protein/TolB-like protein/Tfp pilus assembly protein PilF